MTARDDSIWVIEAGRVGALLMIGGLALGYEQHLHEIVFPVSNLALVLVFALAIVLRRGGLLLRPDATATALFGGAAAFAGLALGARLLLGQETAPQHAGKIALQLLIVTMLLATLTREHADRLLRGFVVVALGAALLNLPIILRGSFMGWTIDGSRPASLFHDANYAGAIFGAALLYNLFRPGERSAGRHAVSVLLAASLAFTYSKGSLIALLVALLWWFLRYRIVWFLLLILPAGLVFGASFDAVMGLLAQRFPLLRIEMGLNFRDVFWSRAVDRILDQPLVGHSVDAVLDITHVEGRRFASIHNYYLENAFVNGVPFVLCVLALIAVSVHRSSRTWPVVGCLTVFFAVASNNFTFSIGSVGLLPFLFTLCVLYPFLRDEAAYGSVPESPSFPAVAATRTPADRPLR